jgi:hypothetical protein
MAVFWDVALYSLVETDRRFRGTYGLYHQIALMMEAVSTSGLDSSGFFWLRTWTSGGLL